MYNNLLELKFRLPRTIAFPVCRGLYGQVVDSYGNAATVFRNHIAGHIFIFHGFTALMPLLDAVVG